MQQEKMQMNVYVPEDINDYVERIRKETGLSKSEVVSIALIYTRQFWTSDSFKDIAKAIRMIGVAGVQKVA